MAPAPREAALIELLRRIPETWEEYDPDQLTQPQAEALKAMVAAGFVERRSRIRLSLANHGDVVEATITCTGEGGLYYAVLPLISQVFARWHESFRDWIAGETAALPPIHGEELRPAEWRLTDQGVLARGEERPAILIDFAFRQGAVYTFRPPVQGSGSLVKIDIKSRDATKTVDVGNWSESEKSISAAIVAAFEQLTERGVTIPALTRITDGPRPPNLFHWAGTDYEASATLFRLLMALWEAPGRKLPFEAIEDEVWEGSQRSEKTLKNLPSKLTKWFADNKLPFLVETKSSWATLVQI